VKSCQERGHDSILWAYTSRSLFYQMTAHMRHWPNTYMERISLALCMHQGHMYIPYSLPSFPHPFLFLTPSSRWKHRSFEHGSAGDGVYIGLSGTLFFFVLFELSLRDGDDARKRKGNPIPHTQKYSSLLSALGTWPQTLVWGLACGVTSGEYIYTTYIP
jgi:hypothetical protein